jgi:hypothetical protein
LTANDGNRLEFRPAPARMLELASRLAIDPDRNVERRK